MIPPPFRYLAATSVADALALLAADRSAVVLAGGQTLLNALKLDLVSPSALIDVHRLPELRTVEHDASIGALRIGAAVTYAELAVHPLVREHVPSLAQVCATMVDRQVRNRGTIGGNCCLNDPACNLPPLLAALDARFEFARHGEPLREAGPEEFFLGALLTLVAGGALLTAVTIPVTGSGTRVAYRHQLVGADSWALARAVVRVDLTGEAVTGVRVFLAAVPGSPVRLRRVEDVLRGGLDAATGTAALAAFDADPVETLADSHGSAAYRLALARVQLRRAIAEVSTPSTPAQEVAA